MGTTISSEDFLANFVTIFDETFEHPPRAEGSAYLDKGVSWRQTLSELDAEEASTPPKPGGTSVAAQVGHALYYLEVVEEFVRGGKPKLDWPGSWSTRSVTDEEWSALQERFFAAYGRLRSLWSSPEEWGDRPWDEDAIGDAMVVLVHSAYHLGSVRQIAHLVAGGM